MLLYCLQGLKRSPYAIADSWFVKNATESQIKELRMWREKGLNVSLERYKAEGANYTVICLKLEAFGIKREFEKIID